MFDRPIVTPSVDASVTVSIGVVTATPHAAPGVDADTLLRDADTAMHDAKAQGGAIIGQFHDGLRSAVVYRADLERRLVGAVARGEIFLSYQPIVGIPGRAVVGFEALARWKQGLAVLPPAQWIPVAESTSSSWSRPVDSSCPGWMLVTASGSASTSRRGSSPHDGSQTPSTSCCPTAFRLSCSPWR